MAANDDALCVLVVEDDLEIRTCLGEILQDEGYGVVLAVHGQAALARLDDTPVRPKLILLDLMMPVMDGWGFRRAQLSRPELAAIPVVLMSASSTVRDPEGWFDQVAYLRKPLEIDDLLATVARLAGPPPR